MISEGFHFFFQTLQGVSEAFCELQAASEGLSKVSDSVNSECFRRCLGASKWFPEDSDSFQGGSEMFQRSFKAYQGVSIHFKMFQRVLGGFQGSFRKVSRRSIYFQEV